MYMWTLMKCRVFNNRFLSPSLLFSTFCATKWSRRNFEARFDVRTAPLWRQLFRQRAMLSPQEGAPEAPSLWEQNTCNQSIPRPFHNSFHHLLSSHWSLLSAKVSTRQENYILTQHIRWHSLGLPTLHQHALSRVHLGRIENSALDSLYRISESLKSWLRKNKNYVKNLWILWWGASTVMALTFQVLFDFSSSFYLLLSFFLSVSH